jgi:hypothetical protein
MTDYWHNASASFLTPEPLTFFCELLQAGIPEGVPTLNPEPFTAGECLL